MGIQWGYDGWLVVSTPLKNMNVSWDHYSLGINSYCGPFPGSLRLAPVSCWWNIISGSISETITGWWLTYPSENMKVSWDHYSQYMGKKKTCSKPPTSNMFGITDFRGETQGHIEVCIPMGPHTAHTQFGNCHLYHVREHDGPWATGFRASNYSEKHRLRQTISGWWFSYPLKNRSSSVRIIFPNIWKVIKNVWNHQPNILPRKVLGLIDWPLLSDALKVWGLKNAIYCHLL